MRDAAEESPCCRVHGSAENCDSTACTARHSSQADRARPRFRPRRVALSVAVGLPMSANAVEMVLDFRRLDAIVQM